MSEGSVVFIKVFLVFVACQALNKNLQTLNYVFLRNYVILHSLANLVTEFKCAVT